MALDPRDPRVQRLLRERQLVAEAEARAEQRRLAEEQEDLAKKIKTAEAMGLSEAEKEEYLAEEAPSLKAKIDESSAATATPAPEAESPTSGIGPLASGQKYSSLLDALRGQQTKEPIGASVSPETKTTVTELSKSSSALNKKQADTQVPGQTDVLPPSTPLSGFKPEPEKPEDTLLARLKKAETGREEARKRADIGQLAEMVGKSLTQIGAAQQGMRTGVDLSGIAQGKGIDWEARRAEIAKDYETELASVSKEREQLLEKERRAEEANNNKELLALKKQEVALSQRETNARIDKLKAETTVAQKEAERMLLPTMTKEQREQLNVHRTDWGKIDKEKAIVDGANLTINDNLDKAEKLDAQKKGADAVYNDRAAVTAYLKQLDPVSAVLAAEYEGARSKGDLQTILNDPRFATVPQQAKDWMFATLAGTLQPAQRKALRQAANTDYKAKSQIYNQQISVIFNRAAQDGIPSPSLIAGERWNIDQLDKQTRQRWKDAVPEQKDQTGTEETAQGTVPAKTKMPGVVAFKSAEEALKARGK